MMFRASLVRAFQPVGVFTALILTCSSSPATARSIINCSQETTTGWNFYCDPERSKPQEQQPPPPKSAKPPQEPVEQAEEEPPAHKTAQERLEEFRAHESELKARAVLDPTPENLKAYMEVNKEMAQKARAFAETWKQVLYSTPSLDKNTEYPLNEMGTAIYQDQMLVLRRETFQALAKQAGVIFVFEDPVKCRICVAQAEILSAMAAKYNLEILAVSGDGSQISQFPNAVSGDRQLAALGLQDTPRPFIAFVNPKTNGVQLIGGGLLSENQILERVHFLYAKAETQ